jgi:hypothetical protein
MTWRWNKITCWLLSVALCGAPGSPALFAAAVPTSPVPVSSQEEEVPDTSETDLTAHSAHARTVRKLLTPVRARALTAHHSATLERSVSSRQPRSERTRHKGVGTHLRP